MAKCFLYNLGGVGLYKLIAIDLDGTLLDNNKKISRENLDTINMLIKKGYEIVIATGRRYWSAKELTKEIDGHMTILANNGNIVRNSENDQILIEKYLNIEDFRVVVSEGRKRNLHPIVHINGYEEGFDIILEFHKQADDYLIKDNRYKRVNNYLEIKDDRILAVVYTGTKSLIHSFNKDINERFTNRYNTHVMENIQSVEAFMEVMHPLGSKWLSLVEYAKKIKINPEEIIAIGDDNNDIDMIKNSGLGIAMKNASFRARSVAKIITEKDNDELGVAFELKRVLSI